MPSAIEIFKCIDMKCNVQKVQTSVHVFPQSNFEVDFPLNISKATIV